MCCRYRKYNIAEDIDLVVRCEIDGVMPYKGQDQLLSIKALNEFDSKTTGKLVQLHVPGRMLFHPACLCIWQASHLTACNMATSHACMH